MGRVRFKLEEESEDVSSKNGAHEVPEAEIRPILLNYLWTYYVYCYVSIAMQD